MILPAMGNGQRYSVDVLAQAAVWLSPDGDGAVRHCWFGLYRVGHHMYTSGMSPVLGITFVRRQ